MATYQVTGSWNGGHQAEVTVMNHGASALSGWGVNWTVPSGQTINSVWNGTLSQSSGQATVRNVDWNAQVSPDGTRSFGMSVNSPGTNPAVPTLTCNSP
jgi:chitin-binding protein